MNSFQSKNFTNLAEDRGVLMASNGAGDYIRSHNIKQFPVKAINWQLPGHFTFSNIFQPMHPKI
jgi:hypothetical protein